MDGDAGAVIGQALGDGPADSPARTGDEGGLAMKGVHIVFLQCEMKEAEVVCRRCADLAGRVAGTCRARRAPGHHP
ncbi:hypothetical protein GCM10018953_52090 [Streptosporangium nondiastaticum]